MSVKFSVIMPVYNRAHTLERALDSLMAQSYRNFEVIIVDDGSTDNSVLLVRQYLADERFKLVLLPENRGVNQARNTGFDHIAVNSDWVTFLDSDDEFLPEALSLMLEQINAEPARQDFCFSVVDQNGKNYSQLPPAEPYLGYLQQIDQQTKARGEWVHTIATSLVRQQKMRFPTQVRNGFEGIAFLTLARCTGTFYSSHIVRRYFTEGEGLTRISHKSKQKALDEIQGYQMFLSLFGQDFRRYASTDYALFQSVLAKNFVETGQLRNALLSCWLAFCANPFELRVYRNLMWLVFGMGRLSS